MMIVMFRRVRRQIPRDIKQGCTTTGYEKRIRELCEEVLETICKVSGGGELQCYVLIIRAWLLQYLINVLMTLTFALSA